MMGDSNVMRVMSTSLGKSDKIMIRNVSEEAKLCPGELLSIEI